MKSVSMTDTVRKAYAELKARLDDGTIKISVHGAPGGAVHGLLKVTPLLCDYIETLQMGLMDIARAPKNGCMDCASTSAAAEIILVGPKAE